MDRRRFLRAPAPPGLTSLPGRSRGVRRDGGRFGADALSVMSGSVPAWLSRAELTTPRQGRPRVRSGGAARASPLARAVRLYLDHLTVERGLATNSLAAYRRDLSRYLAFCERRAILEVSAVERTDIADFLVALREGDAEHPPLAASSAGRAVVAVRGFHRFAAREGLTVTDPGKDVRPPTCPRSCPRRSPSRRSRRSWTPPGPRARRGRCATGRCSRCSTRPAPGSPRRSGSTSTTSTPRRRRSCCGARGARSAWCRSAPRDRRGRGLPRPRAPGPGGRGARRTRDVRQPSRRPPLPAERLDGPGGGGRARRGHGRGLAAHAAALVRHPPARRRRRRPCRAGAARATPRSPRRRSTPSSRSTGCARSTPWPTRAHAADLRRHPPAASPECMIGPPWGSRDAAAALSCGDPHL